MLEVLCSDCLQILPPLRWYGMIHCQAGVDWKQRQSKSMLMLWTIRYTALCRTSYVLLHLCGCIQWFWGYIYWWKTILFHFIGKLTKPFSKACQQGFFSHSSVEETQQIRKVSILCFMSKMIRNQPIIIPYILNKQNLSLRFVILKEKQE